MNKGFFHEQLAKMEAREQFRQRDLSSGIEARRLRLQDCIPLFAPGISPDNYIDRNTMEVPNQGRKFDDRAIPAAVVYVAFHELIQAGIFLGASYLLYKLF